MRSFLRNDGGREQRFGKKWLMAGPGSTRGPGRHNLLRDVQENARDLPGVETAPAGNSDRYITGHWIAGKFP
ncbi:hypothetical protein V8C42DRAFT_343079 [Trichoderma barbatum]